MGIRDNDTFSISWIACYENSLNFYCALIVEAYENVFVSDDSAILIAMGNMKSKIKMELSNGETFQNMSCWNQVVVSGLYSMQEFLLSVLKGMKMHEEEAVDTVIELTDALEEHLFVRESDPRLN